MTNETPKIEIRPLQDQYDLFRLRKKEAEEEVVKPMTTNEEIKQRKVKKILLRIYRGGSDYESITFILDESVSSIYIKEIEFEDETKECKPNDNKADVVSLLIKEDEFWKQTLLTAIGRVYKTTDGRKVQIVEFEDEVEGCKHDAGVFSTIGNECSKCGASISKEGLWVKSNKVTLPVESNSQKPFFEVELPEEFDDKYVEEFHSENMDHPLFFHLFRVMTRLNGVLNANKELRTKVQELSDKMEGGKNV